MSDGIGDIFWLTDSAEGHSFLEFPDVIQSGSGFDESPPHLCFHQTRSDDVHPDSMTFLFGREGTCERLHRSLGHVVGSPTPGIELRGGTGNHDDVSSFVLSHAWQGQLGELMRRKCMNPHQAVYFTGLGIRHGLASACDSSIVDQDTGIAHFLLDGLHHVAESIDILKRGLEDSDSTSEVGNGLCSLLGGFIVLIVMNGDIGSVFRERQ